MTAAPLLFQRWAAETSPPPAEASSIRLVVARVRALVQRRLAWLHEIGGVAQSEDALPIRHVQLVLGGSDNREAEQLWFTETRDPRIQALNRELAALESELANDADSPVSDIAARLDLSDAERDVLEVCLAFAVEPGLLSICGYLHNDPECTHVSEALVAQLCGRSLPLLARDGALLAWRVVREAATDARPASLALDPFILELAAGRRATDPVLAPHLRVVPAREPLPNWPAIAVAEKVGQALANGTAVRVIVKGPRSSGRSTFAACVARLVGMDAVRVNLGRAPEVERREIGVAAMRYALLTGSAIVWHGANVEGTLAVPTRQPLEFVVGDVDLEPTQAEHGVDETVALPTPNLDERRVLWKRLVPGSNAWSHEEFSEIVERYRVQIGDIAAIGLRGAIGAADAREECRKVTRNRLGELGQLLHCPFTREDLCLAPALDGTLDELLFEAHERTRFWESPGARRLFPRGRGLVGLMTGPPGTGKTMAAQVVAAELGLDLLRIDVASSISKYIGETAKNLKRIFARATEMNAVLLFDEADALFSKRTEVRDAHDRHANTDTNYLLQMLEDFDGIALLATNRRANIDSAFTRRIRFILDFRLPEAAERRAIWLRLSRELAGEEVTQSIEQQIATAAEHAELSGAQIKLALLGALMASRRAGVPLRGKHLYLGIRRELAKVGRNLDANVRGKIQAHDG